MASRKPQKFSERVASMLDRAIQPIAPRWAFNRARARIGYTMLSRMAAADDNRTTRHRTSVSESADSVYTQSIGKVLPRARDIVQNYAIARAVVNAYLRSVVGAGITPRAAVRGPDGRPREDFNRECDARFYRWARSPRLCDVEGKDTFFEKQSLILSERLIAGESIIVLVYERVDGRTYLKLQMIEPEMFDTSLTKNRDNGNDIREGVEINKRGRIIAYHVYTKGHPLDRYTSRPGKSKATRIPASRVIHWFRAERVRQTHGVTIFAPVLKQIEDLAGYDEDERYAKRLESMISFVIRREIGAPGNMTGGIGLPATATDDTVDVNGNKITRWERGIVANMAPGTWVDLLNPQRPGANYQTYMDVQNGYIAAGAGVSRSIMLKRAEGSYSASRQERQEDKREFEPITQSMIDRVLQPIREAWLYVEMLNGLDRYAPEFSYSPELQPAYSEAYWHGPPDYFIEPVKEMKGLELARGLRISTQRDDANKYGRDWREINAQLELEENDWRARTPEPTGEVADNGK